MKPTAIVFDLYGTLVSIDALHGAVSNAGIADAPAFIDAWRTKQIEYSWCVSLMDDYRDFDTLTRNALDYVIEKFDVNLSETARVTLADTWLHLDAYPDVAPTLAALRRRNIPLVVCTNGVARSADRVLMNAGIRDAIDEIISVETVRMYKPNVRVYQMVTSRFTCVPDQIVFVSSNGWDASGAAAFGFRVAWCNRASRPPERLGYAPAVTFSVLVQLEAFLDTL